MTRELDTVALVEDHPDEGLVKEDIGIVVMVHDGRKAFEVGFVTVASDTLRVLTLTVDEIWSISAMDVPHVRVM
ncbi:DUF4926 domain-containing protein [Acidithiobacillus sp. M4-SHS-6]|uniref:DUF4926 domain-containing protein n=1 Tax=Acidithiobacillus sp. M4-SHS-6 TaxID=3383024 RepID=UPI0039BECA0A